MRNFLHDSREKVEKKFHSGQGAQYPAQQHQQQQPQQYQQQQQQQPLQPQHPHQQPDITQQAIDVFLFSKQDNGEIGGIGYWQTANGYTAITLHDLWSQSSRNQGIVRDLTAKVESHHRNFINEFNDDTLWWAVCLIHLYQATQDHHYLDKAAEIWKHISRSVVRKGQYNVHGMDMEGGVFWTTKPGEDQLNSITTALYAEFCALLATATSQSDHRSRLPDPRTLVDAARTSLAWILRCRYRENECVVLDNIKLKSRELVDWAFTYLTGGTIAACAALYSATGDMSYINLATQMARNSMTRREWVEADGTLTESGAYGRGNHEAWKNDDAVGFKSVLVRGLAKLYKVLVDGGGLERQLRQEIASFVRRNFDSLIQRNTNGKGQFGPWWAGPMDLPTSHSQLAVLDVMAAIRLVGQ